MSAITAPDSPRLPALLDPALAPLLAEPALLHELTAGLGSPLHLMLPQAFERNARAFTEALRDADVDGLVLYAKKANKARCLVERCAALGLGIDAASGPELAGALAAGVPGTRIGISGPAKHPALLRLALQHDCLIAIDDPGELDRLAALAHESGRRAHVLLRWRPPSQARSRFGMTEAELDRAMTVCAAQASSLALEGFSFHLSGYAAEARAEAAHRLVERCVDARRLGLAATTIDLGGGFALRYVDSSAWRDFIGRQAPEHYHAGKTFGGGFYPYASDCAAAAMLAAVLRHEHDGRSLAERLREHGLRLLLEPGRALLDQAGLTLFRIQGVKDRGGYGIVTVDGMSFSMSEQWFDSEYLPDPLLIARPGRADHPAPFAAAVAGASCLDSDMVSWRKLPLPRRPEPGDLLCYLNTAGYQMDSNESPFHDVPLPRKVVLELDGSARPPWRLDEVPAFDHTNN